MTIEEIRKRLEDRNLSEVGRRIGCNRQTIYNIAKGITANPKWSLVKALEDYLLRNP